VTEGTPSRVTTQVDGHVLLMGLNRPTKLNAFDLAMIEDLSRAYEILGDDDGLRVGVLFAHGNNFSAGLDLAEMAPLLSASGARLLAGSGRYDPLGLWKPPVPKPVVMAVNGIALTLSIELALACDVVVAADDVRFRQLEVARGLFPFEGGAFRAPAQLGWSNAMRFLLTADEFGAGEALHIGLVQEVVPVGEHVDRAVAVAQTIAARAPIGVRAVLSTARAALAAAEQAGTRATEEALPAVWRSDDAAEGVASFRERRSARFTGE
jgi:enoyl-CoA hydratase